MDRRTVLRVAALGATGVPGCVGTHSDGARTPTGATTDVDAPTETTAERTTPDRTDSPSATGRTATNAPETTTDRCGASVVPDGRRRVHSDYALRIVSESDDPAVAVVVGDWRGTLDTDAMSAGDESFVAATDFERFALLVVQYEKSSSGHELRATDLTTDGDTVRAALCVAGLGGPSDAPVANLFVRVPYSGSPPSHGRVRIRTPTETVSVASE